MKFWQEYGYMIIIAIIIVAVISVIVIIDAHFEEEHLHECEAIGGEYKIIDKEWSGKMEVDVYGCVK